jgi:hypothetical protein
LVRSAENQLVICGRGWAHLGALTAEQENGPNGRNAAYRDKSYSQRHERQTRDVRPAEPPANCRGDKNINESPNGWWHLEHHRRSLGSLQYIRARRPPPANRQVLNERGALRSEGSVATTKLCTKSTEAFGQQFVVNGQGSQSNLLALAAAWPAWMSSRRARYSGARYRQSQHCKQQSQKPAHGILRRTFRRGRLGLQQYYKANFIFSLVCYLRNIFPTGVRWVRARQKRALVFLGISGLECRASLR